MHRSPPVPMPIVDGLAAAMPALAAWWSAALVGPLLGEMPAVIAPLVGAMVFVAGLMAMRAAGLEQGGFALADFAPAEVRDARADDVLLLDQPLGGALDALAELLLDDPLPTPGKDSRVVQLFPPQPVPDASAMRASIERHLAGGRGDAADAGDLLRDALDELRRSLAQPSVSR